MEKYCKDCEWLEYLDDGTDDEGNIMWDEMCEKDGDKFMLDEDKGDVDCRYYKSIK